MTPPPSVTSAGALVARLRALQTATAGQGATAKVQRVGLLDPAISPYDLVTKVLNYCKGDLGLDPATTFVFDDTLWPDWRGTVYTDRPHTLRLSRRLFTDPADLVETTAHEAMHSHRISQGYLDYDDLAEQVATDYGISIRNRLGFS